MIFLKWSLQVIIHTIVLLIGYIAVPIGVLLTPKTKDRMPKAFDWWNHIQGFITDPISNLPSVPPYNGKPYVSYDVLLDETLRKWNIPFWSKRARILWLYRNPCDGFGQRYQDIILTEPVIQEKGILSSPRLGDREDASWGMVYLRSGPYFEYYRVSKPYTIFGSRRCFVLRLGWKMSGEGWPGKVGDMAEFYCDINPIRKYRSKIN